MHRTPTVMSAPNTAVRFIPVLLRPAGGQALWHISKTAPPSRHSFVTGDHVKGRGFPNRDLELMVPAAFVETDRVSTSTSLSGYRSCKRALRAGCRRL